MYSGSFQICIEHLLGDKSLLEAEGAAMNKTVYFLKQFLFL